MHGTVPCRWAGCFFIALYFFSCVLPSGGRDRILQLCGEGSMAKTPYRPHGAEKRGCVCCVSRRLLTLGRKVVYNRRARKDTTARQRPQASGERWKPCGTDADVITFRRTRAERLAQALRYGAMERRAVKNARNIGGNAAMSSYAHQRCAGGRFFIRMTLLLKESRDV